MPLFRDREFEMDENGRTCLHYAVWGGSLQVMKYLMDCCEFDLGLKTTVSCAYFIYYTYSGKINTMFMYLHTHNQHMHTQYMRHHYAPMYVCLQ